MARHAVLAVLTAAGIAFWAHAGLAQSSADMESLKKEIDSLKQGMGAIQKDLQEIKGLLRARPQAAAAPPAPPAEAIVSFEGSPFKGKKDAKVTIVEFTDYQCPFCSRYARDTFPQIDKDYVQTGKVKYVQRDLPLEQIHPQAMKAAEATHCAGEQGKFWEMHDKLFANQRELSRTDLTKHATALGLNAASFDQCLDSGKATARIRKDITDAEKLQANGTPTFFIGLTEANQNQIKGTRLVGALPYASFKEAIDRLLASPPAQK